VRRVAAEFAVNFSLGIQPKNLRVNWPTHTIMFARVFNTAKRVLSRSPSVQTPPAESREATPTAQNLDLAMVSTRSGANSTPRSEPRNGKRALEAGDTPISFKKRKKSVGIEKIDNNSPREEDDVETETAEQAGSPTSEKKEKLPIRRRTNPMVVINKSSQSGSTKATSPPSPQEQAHSRATTPSKKTRTSLAKSAASSKLTGSDNGASPTVDIDPPVFSSQGVSDSAASPESEKEQNKSKSIDTPTPAVSVAQVVKYDSEVPSSTYESEQAAIPPQDIAPTPSLKPDKVSKTPRSNKKASRQPEASNMFMNQEDISSLKSQSEKTVTSYLTFTPTSLAKDQKEHVQFGSAEPEVEADSIYANARELEPTLVDKLDDESDSDEAPEEVTAASALRQAQAADEGILRAQKALEEKGRLKKKARADRIKQEQGIKQKKAEEKAIGQAKQKTQEDHLQSREELNVDVHNLPTLLPDSLLEAVGDTRPPTPPRQQSRTAEQLKKEKLARHIKFLERGEKPIKDVKKGSLSVHVLAQQNMLLAPKVNRDTRNIRERWLKGRQTDKHGMKGRTTKMRFQKVERRAIGGGFLRNED